MGERIIICTSCKGSGFVEQSELEDYHNGLYNKWKEKCFECQGSGRLVEKTEIQTFPYEPIEVKGGRKSSES